MLKVQFCTTSKPELSDFGLTANSLFWGISLVISIRRTHTLSKHFNRKSRDENEQTCYCMYTQMKVSSLTVHRQKSQAQVSIFKDLIHGYFPEGIVDCVSQ